MKLLQKLFNKQPAKREAVRLAEQVIDMHIKEQMEAEKPDAYKLRIVYEHLERSGTFTSAELKAFDKKLDDAATEITENKFRVWATAHLVGAAELPDPFKAEKAAGSGLVSGGGFSTAIPSGVIAQQYVQEYNSLQDLKYSQLLKNGWLS